MSRLGRPALLAAPAVAVLVAQWIAVRPIFIDDSFIFYRYADNWADGLGPVFNRDEYVEGFTSFVWLVLLTAGSVLGISPEDTGPALGLAAAIGTIVVLAAAARDVFRDQPLLAAGVALAAALPIGVPYYAASGMDTPLFALALTAAALGAARWAGGEEGSRRTLLACALLALLVLVRAEGVVYAGVIALAAALLVRRSPRGPRAAVPLLAAVAGTALAVFAVRIAVYDSLVPATVSAKGAATHHLAHADLGELKEVIRAGLRYEGFVVLGLALALAAGLLRVRRSLPPLILIGAAVVYVNLAISVWAGGDWMSHRRHLVPVLPLLALVAAWTAAANAAGPRPRPRTVALAAGAAACLLTVIALGLQPSRLTDDDRAPEPDYLDRIGRVTARTPDTTLVTNVAGVLPYRAGARTYTWDMLGLTDEHNANHGDVFIVPYGRTDYDYTYGRDWDVLVTNSTNDADALFDRLDAGRDFGPMAYLDSGPWIDERLSVLVRPGHPIAAALRAECACRALELTPAVRADLRTRLGLPPAAP